MFKVINLPLQKRTKKKIFKKSNIFYFLKKVVYLQCRKVL